MDKARFWKANKFKPSLKLNTYEQLVSLLQHYVTHDVYVYIMVIDANDKQSFNVHMKLNSYYFEEIERGKLDIGSSNSIDVVRIFKNDIEDLIGINNRNILDISNMEDEFRLILKNNTEIQFTIVSK
ncbi:hypothetical protein [Gottfriedia solisilvae]|uniref:hypothetical protein n=1 Tax=Gottfriedia solisilvae TaxID=1516104 RepID=UPI003D2ECBFB